MSHDLMDKNTSCGKWEAALTDLLDGALPATEENELRRHAAGCESCGVLLRESEHGRDWARLLHDAPLEAPAALFGKILAATEALPMLSGADPALPVGEIVTLPQPAFLPGGHRAARMLMTATMALFSLALTASVTGVHPEQVRAVVHDTVQGAGPDSLQVTTSRRFFDAKKQFVSFYDNLRLVREVETRVDALRPEKQTGPSARLENEPGNLPCSRTPSTHAAPEGNRL